MNKKLIVFLLALVFLVSVISCTRSRREEKATDSTRLEESKNQESGGRLGLGRGGHRRGLGRASRARDDLELSDKEREVVEIETIKAFFKPLKSYLEAMGKVIAHQHKKAIVSYAFPARIAEVHVRVGDWVKQSQRLVTLQSEEVGEAKSAYYRAKADYELAKSNFEREKRLFDRGVGAQKNLLTTEAEFKVAGANLNAAEKKLHVLGFSEEEIKIIDETHQINPIITLYAPLAGKIVQNNAVLGAMIDQSSEILTIMDPRLLWVDADIFERDISKIRIGQGVEVQVPAFPGERFSGKVLYIGDILKEDTRTITVRTEVDNKDYKLKPGMFASIKIFLNHQARALVIPEEAILDDGNDKIVFVQKEKKFICQVVETGTKENGYVEILKGLQEGDAVVTKGNYQLKSKLYDEILKKAGVH